MTCVPPGAALERTALAWRRTALATAVNGVLLLHSPHVYIVAALLVLALAAATAAAVGRARDANGGVVAASERRAHVLLIVAVAVAALDLVAVVS